MYTTVADPSSSALAHESMRPLWRVKVKFEKVQRSYALCLSALGLNRSQCGVYKHLLCC